VLLRLLLMSMSAAIGLIREERDKRRKQSTVACV
jgi:hypothetical protein